MDSLTWTCLRFDEIYLSAFSPLPPIQQIREYQSYVFMAENVQPTHIVQIRVYDTPCFMPCPTHI
jgi:hypothetical protein